MKREIVQLSTDEKLNYMLADWHKWARGASLLPAGGACAMFRDAKSSRGWDTTDEIIDGELTACEHRALDFHIGELAPDHRTAIGIQARNLVTGLNVWSSARLPACMFERAKVVDSARTALKRRLSTAGML